MARFVLYRGTFQNGNVTEVPFEELGMWSVDMGGVAMACTCLLCGSLVFSRPNCERHADFHFALAAGRPFGVMPPGFAT